MAVARSAVHVTVFGLILLFGILCKTDGFSEEPRRHERWVASSVSVVYLGILAAMLSAVAN